MGAGTATQRTRYIKDGQNRGRRKLNAMPQQSMQSFDRPGRVMSIVVPSHVMELRALLTSPSVPAILQTSGIDVSATEAQQLSASYLAVPKSGLMYWSARVPLACCKEITDNSPELLQRPDR